MILKLFVFVFLPFLPMVANAGIVADINGLPSSYDANSMTGSFTTSNLLRYLPLQSPTACRFLTYSPAIDYSTSPNIPDDLWSWSEDDPLAITETLTSTRFDGINSDFEYTDVTMKAASGTFVSLKYTKTKYPSSGAPNSNRVYNLNGRSYNWSSEEVGVWLEGCLAASQAPTFKDIISALSNKYDSNDAGTQGYATVALTLLSAWADEVPNYVLRVYNSHYVMTPEDCEQFSNDGGAGSMAGCSLTSHYNGPAHELDYVPLSEYENVMRCSDCLTSLSSSQGKNIQSNIEMNLFDRVIRYFLPVDQGGAITPMWKSVQSNLLLDCPKILDISAVLPSAQAEVYPEFCVEYLDNVLQHQLVRDGSVLESFTYAYLPQKSSYLMSSAILSFFEGMPVEEQTDEIRASLSRFTELRSLQEVRHFHAPTRESTTNISAVTLFLKQYIVVPPFKNHRKGSQNPFSSPPRI